MVRESTYRARKGRVPILRFDVLRLFLTALGMFPVASIPNAAQSKDRGAEPIVLSGHDSGSASEATFDGVVADLKAKLAERDAQIATLRARVAALSPAPEPNLDTAVGFEDVAVAPGQRRVQVPVTLSSPTDHTVALRWQAQNGQGTNQGTHYAPASGWVVFQPGEARKFLPVELLRDLNPEQTIRIVLTSTPNNPPLKQRRSSATIRGGGHSREAVAAVSGDHIAMPARPRGKSLSWQQNFSDPSFCVTDSGRGVNGAPCWQGRPVHGLFQEGNKELGIYASPDRFPGVVMTGLGSDGKRFIQLERHPQGFSEKGKAILRPWDQQPFVYSSAMLQGSKLPVEIRTGSYVEARLKMDLVQGAWPAFWLLTSNGSWPPEIDVFEGFWRKGSVAADILTMSLHWMKAGGGHGTYGTDVPIALSVPNFDLRKWHTYGVLIEDAWLTYYVDDQPVWRAPNATNRGAKWYPLLNVTTGGLVGEPPADAVLPSRMSLDWIRVWN